MRILNLTVRNFMPFRGDHEVGFPVSAGRNVYLIYGDNMRGKTSLLNALRWVLYGKVLGRHMKPIAIRNILNKDAFQDREFEVRVTLKFQHAGSLYELSRSMRPKDLIDTPRDDDHFESLPPDLKKDGAPVSGHLVDHELNQILPESISRFSLFDGELLQEYEQLVSDATEESTKIKDAIEKVLGVPTLTNARTHVREILDRAQAEFANVGLKDSRHQALVQQAKLDLDVSLRESERLNQLTESARDQVESCDEKLRQYASAEQIKWQVEENRRQQNVAASERDRALARLRELAPRAWLAIIDATVSARRDAVESELVVTQESFAKHIEERTTAQYRLRSLQSGECALCEEPLSERSKAAFQFAAKLTQETSEIQAFSDRLTEVTRRLQTFRSLAAPGLAEELTSVEREIDRCRIQLVELQGREAELLDEIPGIDLTELGRLREQRDKWHRELSKMEILLASELSKRDAAKKKYDAAVRMAATGQQGSSKRLGDKVTLLNGAAEVFEQSVEQMRSRLRDEVELSATDAFKKLSTESQYSGLVINDRYGLEIRDHLDRPVSVRSAGAEQIVALALIDGLNTAAGKRGPLVMDTPFGRLDVQHRARVLSYLPSMAEQVILLVHEGEMSHERDLPHIAGLVAAAYQINRVSPTQSSIEPK